MHRSSSALALGDNGQCSLSSWSDLRWLCVALWRKLSQDFWPKAAVKACGKLQWVKCTRQLFSFDNDRLETAAGYSFRRGGQVFDSVAQSLFIIRHRCAGDEALDCFPLWLARGGTAFGIDPAKLTGQNQSISEPHFIPTTEFSSLRAAMCRHACMISGVVPGLHRDSHCENSLSGAQVW